MAVIEFRFRKVGLAPLDGVAETGAARFLTGPDRAVSTSHPRYDAHADGFHAAHGFGKRLIPTDDLWGLDHPLSKAVCYALIGLAGLAIWGAGAFAWWAVG